MKKFFILFSVIFLANIAFAQWFQLSSVPSRTFTSVYFINPAKGYITSADDYPGPCNKIGAILGTSNGGSFWTTQYEGCGLYSIFFPSNDTGYVSSWYIDGKSYTAKTTNGGFWGASSFNNGIAPWFWSSVFFVNTEIGYGVGNAFYKTSNGGATWIQLPIGIVAGDLKSVYFTDEQNGYAVSYKDSSKGYILKTSNAGMNWFIQDSCNAGGLKSIFFVDQNTGFAVGGNNNGVIFKTTNGGIEWTENVFTQTTGPFHSVYFTDVLNGYVVGAKGSIMKTIDGGTTWNNQYSGTIEDLYAVHFPATDTGYAVGTNGTILKTTNGGGFPTGFSNKYSSDNTLKIQPNPASDILTINPSTIGNLILMDLSGQKIIQQELIEPNAMINVSSLKNGVYLLKFIGKDEILVGKLLKQ